MAATKIVPVGYSCIANVIYNCFIRNYVNPHGAAETGIFRENLIKTAAACRVVRSSWWRHQMEHFPRYWPFVRGINWSPVNSPHKGQCRGALMFSLIYAWISGWANNRGTGDLRRHRTHDVTVVIAVRSYCMDLTAPWLPRRNISTIRDISWLKSDRQFKCICMFVGENSSCKGLINYIKYMADSVAK